VRRRRRQPEEELALLQILVRERQEVLVGGELACDRDLERPSIGLLDDGDHVRDPVLAVRPHADRDHSSVPVRREQARILVVEVGANVRRPARRLQCRRQPLDLELRVPVGGHVLSGRPGEHDLVDEVVRRRQVPEDGGVALLRLRVVRDRRLGCDRRGQQQRDRRD
jgi:hypothetical protein